jgi:hypothetical protein
LPEHFSKLSLDEKNYLEPPMRKFAAILCCIFLVTGLAQAGNAQASYIAELQKKAERGDAIAQYDLGTMYYSGNGVSPDATKAAYWYEKSAKQGHADAQLELAVMYEKGAGVPQDYAKAIYWYQKAAKQGHDLARIWFCFLYENWELVEGNQEHQIHIETYNEYCAR